MSIILGIDPGSRITGFGIIKVVGKELHYISSGCVRMKETDVASRLAQIFSGLKSIIAEYRPNFAAIEQIFMHVNPAGALKLGQARGAAMVAVTEQAIPIAEYSARQIKLAVVGYGAADKSQVQHMVRCLLKLDALPQADAADALAVAVCHAHSRREIT